MRATPGHCVCRSSRLSFLLPNRAKGIMHVEHITTWDGLASLENQWNALAGNMPFHSWNWSATWWKHYGDVIQRSADHGSNSARPNDRQLYVLAVFEESNAANDNVERLVGVAPWYLDR